MYSVTHNTATFINKVLMSQAYVTVKLYLYSMADFFAPVYTSVSIAKPVNGIVCSYGPVAHLLMPTAIIQDVT